MSIAHLSAASCHSSGQLREEQPQNCFKFVQEWARHYSAANCALLPPSQAISGSISACAFCNVLLNDTVNCEVTAELNEVTEWLNEVTVELNEVTAGLNEVSAELNEVAAEMSEVTEWLNEMTVWLKEVIA